MTPRRLSQFAIAAFDGWSIVHDVLAQLRSQAIDVASASVMVREDIARARATSAPQDADEVRLAALVREITGLRFAASRQAVYCTSGRLAAALANVQGATSLADALRPWLMTGHAERLQAHIDKGRILLWFELGEAEASGTVCGLLLRASPHLLEIHDIDLPATAASPSA